MAVNYLQREAGFLSMPVGYDRDNSQSVPPIREQPSCFEFGKPSGYFFNQLVAHPNHSPDTPKFTTTGSARV